MPHRDDETRGPLSEGEVDQKEAERKEMKRRKFLKIVGGSLGGPSGSAPASPGSRPSQSRHSSGTPTRVWADRAPG